MKFPQHYYFYRKVFVKKPLGLLIPSGSLVATCLIPSIICKSFLIHFFVCCFGSLVHASDLGFRVRLVQVKFLLSWYSILIFLV